jgi:hypothetical protein
MAIKFNKIIDRARDSAKAFDDKPIISTIKATNAVLSAPVKAVDGIVGASGRAVNATTKHTGMQWAGKKAGKGYGKSLVDKDPNGANFFNAFTGHKEGSGMIATAAVGGGLYAGAESFRAVRLPEDANTGETSYTGTAPIHNADGVSSAPSLGASGDMVLGMSKGRRR